MTGTVILYSKNDSVLRRSWYGSQSYRTLVINGWRYLYGKRFKECYLGIMPDAKPEQVNDRGLNGIPVKRYRGVDGKYAKEYRLKIKGSWETISGDLKIVNLKA